jgi:hypothetical protein
MPLPILLMVRETMSFLKCCVRHSVDTIPQLYNFLGPG